MPFPYDETSTQSPEKRRKGVMQRARAQILIAARLTALGDFAEAAFMVEHAEFSIDHWLHYYEDRQEGRVPRILAKNKKPRIKEKV